ncbi:MAG: HDIG domain-containing protein [Prevotella sp.]|nr:HDIG domain-containing protein [Prevotella sp.]MDY2634694.1 HDIG domain-containing protein [Prevotella sp.]
MHTLTYKDENFLKHFFIRTAIVLVMVAIIVSFLPKHESEHYRYVEGKPWTEGTVIAKFQFPVYKSEEAIDAERDSIVEHFQPYYRLDPNVEKTALDELAARFINEDISAHADNFKYTTIQELHRIYQAGVMSQAEYARLMNDTSNVIRLVSGKEAVSLPVKNVYSTKTAYEHLFENTLLAEQRTLVQQLNLNDFIRPNLVFDRDKNESEREEQLQSIIETDDMVMAGQKIIGEGDIVTPYTARVLASLEKEQMKRNGGEDNVTHRLVGNALLVLILMTLFTVYLSLFRNDYFSRPRTILMLYLLLLIFPIMVSMMSSYAFLSVYILPYAMLPIFIRIFMDSRTASMAHFTMILLCALALKYQYEFIFIQLVAGQTAVFSLRELSKRSQLFKASILVTLSAVISFYGLQVIQDSDFFPLESSIYIHILFSGLILLLAYPLMYVIEKIFGFTSSVTLFELSDTNKDLLRQLSEVAPGTFQHSIMVGNLASAIANQIGAKGLLVRTGALYHDIGKMTDPVYFTENQMGANPHEGLTEKESARIILNHVYEGIKLAEKHDLPRVIKDFILTHHGTGLTKYFYIQYKNKHPEEPIDERDFAYPGPNPFTREQAVLMMADSVEAASRTIGEYTEENISNLVNKIIDGQVADGLFKECPITFRDIAVAKSVLIERLKSIYHTRIRYPELKKNEETTEA